MPRFLSLVVLAALVLAPGPARAADDPWFSQVVQKNQTFYPRVPDNYKDMTEIDWRVADTDFAECWATLYDPDGNVLMDENTSGISWRTQFEYDCGNRSGNWLQWNGLDKDGRRVPVGRYRIEVRYLDDADQVVHRLTRHVRVATGTKWVKQHYSVRGSEFDTKRTRGNCRVSRMSGEATLDCWGGRFATVGYDFYVQYDLDIKNFRWHVSGSSGCCDRGVVRKTGVRHRHDLDIDVRVTNWRSYDVSRVSFSWSAKNRV
jgi:hypothetical protein